MTDEPMNRFLNFPFRDFTLIVWLVMLLGCSSTREIKTSNVLTEERRLEALTSESPPIILAVFPFDNNTGEPNLNHLSAAFADILITELLTVKEIRVVERTKLDRIMEEHGIQLSDLVNPQTRVRIGQLVGAQALFYGGFSKLDADTIRIDGRLVSVATTDVLTSVSVENKSERKAIAEIAEKIKETLRKALANYNLRIWMENITYHAGEQMKVFLQSERDCFLRLYHQKANKKGQLIFPNKFRTNNFLRADIVYEIPSKTDNFEFFIDAPFGKEVLIALASTTPFSKEGVELFNDEEALMKEIEKQKNDVREKMGVVAQAIYLFTTSAGER